MSRGLLFWIIMILCFIALVAGYFWYPAYGGVSNGIIAFILFALLGWQVFGPPIK